MTKKLEKKLNILNTTRSHIRKEIDDIHFIIQSSWNKSYFQSNSFKQLLQKNESFNHYYKMNFEYLLLRKKERVNQLELLSQQIDKTFKQFEKRKNQLPSKNFLKNQQHAQTKQKEMKNVLERTKTSSEKKKIQKLFEELSSIKENFDHFLTENHNLLIAALSSLPTEQRFLIKNELFPLVDNDSILHYYFLELSIPDTKLFLSTEEPQKMTQESRIKEKTELDHILFHLLNELKFAQSVLDGSATLKQTKHVDTKKYLAIEKNELQTFILNLKTNLKRVEERNQILKEIISAFSWAEVEKTINYYKTKKHTKEGQNKLKFFLENLQYIHENDDFLQMINDAIEAKDEVKLTELRLLAEDAIGSLSPKERIELVSKCVVHDPINELFGESDVIFNLLNETAI